VDPNHAQTVLIPHDHDDQTTLDINITPVINAIEVNMDTTHDDTAMDSTITVPYWVVVDTNPYGPTIVEHLSLKDRHPTLGLICNKDMSLTTCATGSSAWGIPRWRSRLRKVNVHAVDDTLVHTTQELQDAIAIAQETNKDRCKISFVTSDYNPMDSEDHPQLYFDQIKTIMGHLHEIKHQTPIQWNTDDLVINTLHDTTPSRLTRRYLQTTPEWEQWSASERQQHDKYELQNMFGQPQPPPSQATILNFVWTYVIKLDGNRKARATCDGSKRAGKAVTLAETFAACVDQTSVRIFWATAALQNMLVIGADAGNAFAEAPPPKQ